MKLRALTFKQTRRNSECTGVCGAGKTSGQRSARRMKRTWGPAKVSGVSCSFSKADRNGFRLFSIASLEAKVSIETMDDSRPAVPARWPSARSSGKPLSWEMPPSWPWLWVSPAQVLRCSAIGSGLESVCDLQEVADEGLRAPEVPPGHAERHAEHPTKVARWFENTAALSCAFVETKTRRPLKLPCSAGWACSR